VNDFVFNYLLKLGLQKWWGSLKPDSGAIGRSFIFRNQILRTAHAQQQFRVF